MLDTTTTVAPRGRKDETLALQMAYVYGTSPIQHIAAMLLQIVRPRAYVSVTIISHTVLNMRFM